MVHHELVLVRGAVSDVEHEADLQRVLRACSVQGIGVVWCDGGGGGGVAL